MAGNGDKITTSDTRLKPELSTLPRHARKQHLSVVGIGSRPAKK
jgi:hypothetical protein